METAAILVLAIVVWEAAKHVADAIDEHKQVVASFLHTISEQLGDPDADEDDADAE